MSNNSYYVEYAKSGRSKCKKCKIQINKDDMRIMVEIPGESFNTVQSFHPACFTLPRKFMSGPGKISVEEFVAKYVEDKSDRKLLPSKCAELVAAIESKVPKSDGGSSNVDEDSSDSLISKLKNAYKEFQDAENKPLSKKVKREEESSNKQDTFKQQVFLYGKYHKFTNDAVKDVLGYNRQVKTGTKDFLLMKLIDGITYGRLARCQLCAGGRLKLKEDGTTVVCGGTFDEVSNMRMDCSFRASTAKAPRYQPWYMEEPSDDEKAEMDRLEAEAKGESGGTLSNANEEYIERLSNVSKGKEWNLSNREGLRAAAKTVIELLTDKKSGGGKVADVPSDHGQAMQRVGQMIATNRDLTIGEILAMAVKEFGFKEDKEAKAEKKKESMQLIVGHPANAGLVAAFQELAELYFKTGNANAGSVYVKAVKALSDLKFKVTAANALSLSKGKTKVPNIGKSSAEKIYEYCNTGKIEKLEEKRADASV